MEFGEQWLQPIQTRLAAKFPLLSSAERDEYNAICREAMCFGHEQVVSKIPMAKDDPGMHYDLFRAAVLAKYPWITQKNLGSLFSQGCYYAMK
jgi:hypothetical protein